MTEKKTNIELATNGETEKTLEKALAKTLESIRHAKEMAIRAEKFEVADWLRDREAELFDLIDTVREPPTPEPEPWEKAENIKGTLELFTENTHMAFWVAEQESRKMGHHSMGAELILLGLIGQGTGIAAKTLKSMGVHLKDARAKLEKTIGRGPSFVTEKIHLTPGANKLLWFARVHAKQLGHNYIGTEHLLLAIADEEDQAERRILEILGVDSTHLKAKILELLKGGGAATG